MNRRVALVTGAAGGQGWAIAKRLRAAGYSVAACDRRGDELSAMVDELGDDEVIGIELDVTSAGAVGDGRRHAVVDRFGSLTTLVNSAGVLHRASLADETVEDFENAWRVNCLGAFLGHAGDARARCVRRSTRPSSTSAAPERSAPSRGTAPTVRRSGRCGA